VPARRIEGYAIVSDDGMLAGADGVMPDALKFEADQRFFADGMDGVDVAVHGRHSHEGQPHSPQRKRLIVTRWVKAIGRDPDNALARLWNPIGMPIEDALAAIGESNAAVGVVGATYVFGLFLGRYDVFYLTRAPGVRLPGGRPVFPQVPRQTPEVVLAEYGLIAGPPQVLDPAKNLVVTLWRRGTAPRR
jgi:hypothetical protein